MIIEIDNPILLAKIFKMAEKIEEIEIEPLKKMLTAGIGNKEAKIFVEEKDNEIRGFIFGSREYMNGKEVVFIQACWIDPHAPQAGHEMLNKIRLWAKESGIDEIYFWSYRDPKGFQRKYKFELAGYILKRRV